MVAQELAEYGQLSSPMVLELGFKQIPDYGIPMLSEIIPLHSRAFALLGLGPRSTPALAPPC